MKFVGEHYVSKKGTTEWSVSPAEFEFLVTSIKRAGFFSFKERYRYEADGCKSWWTDNPTLDIVVTRGAQRKRVSYYYGCKGIPESARLDWLGKTIDDVAGTYAAVGNEEEP